LAGSFSANNLTPVSSAGATPVPSAGATGQAGLAGQAGFKVQLDLIEKKGGVWRIVDPIFGVWLAG